MRWSRVRLSSSFHPRVPCALEWSPRPSLITTNLPTAATIVNSDAHADGAGNSANNYRDWYQPFGGNVSLTPGPGTYTFTVVNV